MQIFYIKMKFFCIKCYYFANFLQYLYINLHFKINYYEDYLKKDS